MQGSTRDSASGREAPGGGAYSLLTTSDPVLRKFFFLFFFYLGIGCPSQEALLCRLSAILAAFPHLDDRFIVLHLDRPNFGLFCANYNCRDRQHEKLFEIGVLACIFFFFFLNFYFFSFKYVNTLLHNYIIIYIQIDRI